MRPRRNARAVQIRPARRPGPHFVLRGGHRWWPGGSPLGTGGAAGSSDSVRGRASAPCMLSRLAIAPPPSAGCAAGVPGKAGTAPNQMTNLLLPAPSRPISRPDDAHPSRGFGVRRKRPASRRGRADRRLGESPEGNCGSRPASAVPRLTRHRVKETEFEILTGPETLGSQSGSGASEPRSASRAGEKVNGFRQSERAVSPAETRAGVVGISRPRGEWRLRLRREPVRGGPPVHLPKDPRGGDRRADTPGHGGSRVAREPPSSPDRRLLGRGSRVDGRPPVRNRASNAWEGRIVPE